MPLPWKTATLCFLHREGKTLFLDYTHFSHPIHQGSYAPPGGKMEDEDEGDPKRTTIREIAQETGIIIHGLLYRGTLRFENEKRTINAKPFKYNFTVPIYDCYNFDDTHISATEGKIAWIDDDKILALPRHEGSREILKILSRHREFEGIFIHEGEKLSSVTLSKTLPFS